VRGRPQAPVHRRDADVLDKIFQGAHVIQRQQGLRETVAKRKLNLKNLDIETKRIDNTKEKKVPIYGYRWINKNNHNSGDELIEIADHTSELDIAWINFLFSENNYNATKREKMKVKQISLKLIKRRNRFTRIVFRLPFLMGISILSLIILIKSFAGDESNISAYILLFLFFGILPFFIRPFSDRFLFEEIGKLEIGFNNLSFVLSNEKITQNYILDDLKNIIVEYSNYKRWKIIFYFHYTTGLGNKIMFKHNNTNYSFEFMLEGFESFDIFNCIINHWASKNIDITLYNNGRIVNCFSQ
jgi:hypothetical protein